MNKLNLVLVLAIALLSCTPKTQEPSRLPARESIPSQQSEYELQIIAIIEKRGVNSVDDIAVTATTGRHRLSDKTSSNGIVSLKLPYLAGDDIHFEFRKDGNYWVTKTTNIPVGQKKIRVYFTLNSRGAVSFSRIEY